LRWVQRLAPEFDKRYRPHRTVTHDSYDACRANTDNLTSASLTDKS
jgi:hypothetical protein